MALVSYSNNETRVCYILLKSWEIRHIFVDLWGEQRNWGNHDHYSYAGIVDSYPDAVRMCAMVPRIKPGDYFVGSREKNDTVFKANWASIPGPDIKLRLPTPSTVEHIKWLRENVLVDDYNGSYSYSSRIARDRGKLWLGIKRGSLSGNWSGAYPRRKEQYLIDKPGECGFLYRGDTSGNGDGHYKKPPSRKRNNPSGLYFVSCDDTPLESYYTADGYMGRYMVACEFDEPMHCKQELIRDKCIYMPDYKHCMVSGFYRTVQEPHPRIGQPCIENETTSEIPCHRQYWPQCKTDCHYEWVDGPEGCVVPENGKYYRCTDKDINGTMIQKLNIKMHPVYGGKPCPDPHRREIECICGSGKSQGCLMSFLVMLITSYLVS